MSVSFIHKHSALLSIAVLCILLNLRICAQDNTSGLIRYLKIEKATHKNAVNLNWAIAANSTDSMHMLIERSADGKRFQLLETMPLLPAGMDTSYSYTDELPLYDSSFYRVSYKTGTQYLGYAVQKTNFFARPKTDISIMPNPVFNNASIIIQAEELGDINCVLLDMGGKTIRTYQFKKSSPYVQHILDMYNVPKGEYILSIRGATINEAKRILKQ